MSSKSLALGPVPYGMGKIFLKSQFSTKPQRAPADTDLSGKVAIVTGANVGLGLHAATHLLSLKLSHLIVAVRTLEKGEAAAAQLRTAYPSARIEVWIVDMTSYESIQAFVRRVETDLTRLDIAILNAGLTNDKYVPNPSTGHEMVIQVNYLSTFLLAILLLPALKTKSPKGVPGRLSIVGSGMAYAAKLPNRGKVPFLASFDDVNAFNSTEQYAASKALLHMFLVRLVEHIDPEEVVVNIVDPGLCKGTSLNRDVEGLMAVVIGLLKGLTGRSLSDGAWTYIDAAVVKGKESHGCFVMDWEIRP
jgi:NAD(P)-dependent dehydrogenase (short-subunit alcohol dehydrogenase family)